MTPPIAKERGIAGPEMLATTPRIEKIPAPIMPPIPMLRAATSPMSAFRVESGICSSARSTWVSLVNDGQCGVQESAGAREGPLASSFRRARPASGLVSPTRAHPARGEGTWYRATHPRMARIGSGLVRRRPTG